MNVNRTAYRRKNNLASKRSRDNAQQVRRHRLWAMTHPDLSDREQDQVRRFLVGEDLPLTDRARDIIHKHLIAARAAARAHYSGLIRRLEAMDRDSAEA